MILATNKCGCPPKEKPPSCSPCCAFKKKPSPKPALKKYPSKRTIDDVAACCPTKPDSTYERPTKIRSDIAESGLPYKEVEAIINNNRLVIRTQTERGKPIFEPPCDCIEDPYAGRTTSSQDQDDCIRGNLSNRTVTMYPQARQKDSENSYNGEAVGSSTEKRENPNIFLLRVRKKSAKSDKKYHVDVEFKTPRPWSAKKRLEFSEQMEKLPVSLTVSKLEVDGDREKKAVVIDDKGPNQRRKGMRSR